MDRETLRLGQMTPGLVADRHATCTKVEALRHEGQGIAAGQNPRWLFGVYTVTPRCCYAYP